MQDLLTHAIELTAITATVHFTLMLIGGWHDRRHRIDAIFDGVAEAEPMAEPPAPVQHVIIPFKRRQRPALPDYNAMSIRQLKEVARRAKVANYGRMTKARLIEALLRQVA